MKSKQLFIKGDRRYREASDGEVLDAASVILANRAMHGTAARIGGMAEVLKAEEESLLNRELRRIEEQKQTPLAGEKMLDKARRGAEPV